MGYRSGRPTGYKCHACDADVRWSEKYCSRCEQVPERRCLDCGATTRAGTLDYVPAETVAPSWTEYRENIGYEIPFTPKPIKPHEVKWHYVVVPGPCRECDSTNLAPLEFGLDQLPKEQVACAAWPDLGGDQHVTPRRDVNRWVKQFANDPGITLSGKRCTRCGLTFQLGDKHADVRYGGSVHQSCPKGEAYTKRLLAEGEGVPETLHGAFQRIRVAA